MEPRVILGMTIASKKHAKSVIKWLNLEFAKEPKLEMALLVTDYTERIVSAGFLTWEEANVVESEAFDEYARRA